MSWNDSENCFGWGFWYRRCLITSHWSAPACTVNRKSTEEEFASPGERTFKGHFIWPQRKADSKAIWLLNLLQCTGLNFHCFAARDLYFPSSAAPHLQNYWLKIDWLKCYHTECLHQVQGKRERLGFFLLKMPSTSFYCALYLFYFHCCMKLLKSYSAALCGGLMQAVWVSTQREAVICGGWLNISFMELSECLYRLKVAQARQGCAHVTCTAHAWKG